MSGAVSPREFGRRFRKALSVPFMLDKVCSPSVQEFVAAGSAALGCTEKCFFFPLLSCAAACLGSASCVQATPLWEEPTVLWTLVLCPRSLSRADVAEHFKQQVLAAQDRALVKHEDTKEHLKRFLFDTFTLDRLQDTLKLSQGHGLAVYSSVRSLHPNLSTPEQADVLQRLHAGHAWFTDSRVARMTLGRTRVSLALVSTPSAAQHELSTAPNFAELFHQAFLVTCSEEAHPRFAQMHEAEATDKLQEVFASLLQLHHRDPLVYRLGAEAREKFAGIHDELTDKAKQMARKNAHKVYAPALAYLLRLSCVLHVLDNVLDAISYKVPLSRLTWNTEISAAAVWQARELLGHVIEQRHALMEPTTIEGGSLQKAPQQVVNVDGQPHTPPPNHASPARSPAQAHTSPRFTLSNVRRSIFYPPQSTNNVRQRPILTSVRPAYNPASISNGDGTSITPIISSVSSVGVTIPSELSLSLDDGAGSSSDPSPLLSRPPFASVQDLSDSDFLSSHRSSIRRVLRSSASEITPSRCVQQRLTPDPTASDETLRHTHGFARSFLKKVEGLGFGLCEGPKSGHLRNFVFKKKKFSALGDEQKRFLDELKIIEVEYNKCFTAVSSKEQNGGIVCLE